MNIVIACLYLLYILYKLPKAKIRRLYSPWQKNKLWVKYEGRCAYCRIKLVPYKGESFSVEYDHIIPFSKGGLTTLSNGQALCKKCNRAKSDKYPYKIKVYKWWERILLWIRNIIVFTVSSVLLYAFMH